MAARQHPLCWFVLWLLYSLFPPSCSQNGAEFYKHGLELFHRQAFDEAAPELWKAVLFHNNDPSYDVQTVFQQFMQCYIQQGRAADGLAFVSSESFRRGQTDMGKNYLQQALSVDPNNPAALQVQQEFGEFKSKGPNADLKGQTPEQLYALASDHFANKHYEECADVFEISCIRSNYKLGPSCANAVYCRTMILDYGFNGTQFDADMKRMEALIESETKLHRVGNNRTHFAWNRAMSAHPHMMLGYPIASELKRFVAESVAFLDEKMARARESKDGGGLHIPDLPPGLPYDLDTYREHFRNNPKRRIRVGFVGSGFNSKAVLYLSQDMFRFFGDDFEIHIFSFGPPDNPGFIQVGMRGVDWRERVKANVDVFHDMQAMKLDHIKAAQHIHDQEIQILIEWDGYARQGERAQGLFALRPAPIQILHQEYLGTSGALYVDYLVTDKVSTPPELDHLYTEKLIFMPNHFFSKGHAYQSEVKEPTYQYSPKVTPYKLGTGSPQENRCLDPDATKNVSFVFCNFNKFLKNNPETIRSWIRILREVPDSILCLMENPDTGIPYLSKFVHETAGTSKNNDPTTFVPGDGDDLVKRIHFLPWENNPFDHQMRNQDMCNVMLDSHPYNGHTIAQDALYGGVPIVTRSDGDDMSSRVSTSANIVLGLDHLNAYEGPRQYEDIAIQLGRDKELYKTTRTKIVDSCLQRNPMHPYWDVARYVKNFEAGLSSTWKIFMDGRSPEHIYVQESERAQRGTFDKEILANPPQGKSNRME